MKHRLGILLTGASGTIGQEVLKLLYQQTDRFNITVFDIKTKKTLKILSPYKQVIEIVFGDISKFDDIQKVANNKDFVIHLAAIIPPLADENPALAFNVNTTGTENLIRSLEKFSPEAFFLFSSSVAVYGDRLENPLIKVGDPLNPSEGDEYAKTKIKAEEIIRRSGLDWSIFRLTAVMGSHKISKLMFHMPLATPIEIATPEDTAKAFVQAIDLRNLISHKIFNLGGGTKCRIAYKDFLRRSFKILGLGEFNFPENAFAEKNFHCGYFNDGDELENILHFRNDTLDSYFKKVENSTPLWRKIISMIFRRPIMKYLLSKSEPYRAFKIAIILCMGSILNS